jgi:hypothetical protein
MPCAAIDADVKAQNVWGRRAGKRTAAALLHMANTNLKPK